MKVSKKCKLGESEECLDDHIYGSQQNTHNPKRKLPKIITHKWKQDDLLEAPNLLPMKGLFVTKFESNESK